MKKRWLIPLFIAFLVLIDHRIKHGYWYDWRDFKSHEALVTHLAMLSLGMII